jgi:hypothetical protein
MFINVKQRVVMKVPDIHDYAYSYLSKFVFIDTVSIETEYHQMINGAAVGGMRIVKETKLFGENPSSANFPPQIPHDLTWDQTRTTTRLGSWLYSYGG